MSLFYLPCSAGGSTAERNKAERLKRRQLRRDKRAAVPRRAKVAAHTWMLNVDTTHACAEDDQGSSSETSIDDEAVAKVAEIGARKRMENELAPAGPATEMDRMEEIVKGLDNVGEAASTMAAFIEGGGEVGGEAAPQELEDYEKQDAELEEEKNVRAAHEAGSEDDDEEVDLGVADTVNALIESWTNPCGPSAHRHSAERYVLVAG